MPPVGSAVYFLGAGATRADHPNAPLGDELLHQILSDQERDPVLLSFLEDVYPSEVLRQDADATARPRLDDVFTLIDAPLSGRSPAPGTRSSLDLLNVRWRLVAAIGRILKAAFHDIQSPIAPAFAAKLSGTPATIISTNYDLVMDNALFVASRPNLNYGFSVRARVRRGAVPGLPTRAEEARYFVACPEDPLIRTGQIPLLKLHGSLNWLYCPRCDELDVFPGVKVAVEILDSPATGRCAMLHCTGRYEPILVGPSLEQRYSNRILQETWARAEASLTHAETLTIVGYSMPSADYLIRAMLTRQFSRRSDRVTVVTHRDETDAARFADLAMNFRRVFPMCEIYPNGFRSFVDLMPGARARNRDGSMRP